MNNSSTVIKVPKKQRLLSIDALRGFDMVWILGAEGVFAALFTLTGITFFNVAAQQMLHTPWHGFTGYDLIFPLFIFLSGVSLGIAGKPINAYPIGDRQKKIKHAFKRLFLLITLGVLYNHGWGAGVPVDIDSVRFASVLGRIGIAWFVAALLVWFVSLRMQWLIAGTLLLGYWLLLSFVEIDGYGAGNYSSTGALNVWFDQVLLPGATYKDLPLDPEGLLSNLSSIVNALLGVFVGRYMIQHQKNANKLLRDLIGFGALLLILGYIWGVVFPINKTLWTSSFVLVTCGYSTLLLSLFYFVIDVMKIQRWAIFFAVIGTNSIIVYLGTSLLNWQYTVQSLFGGVVASASLSWQPLLQVALLVFLQWLLLLWLYRRKIFIKV